jgi:archaellum component FlaC
MIEQRVARLEDDMKDIKSSLSKINDRLQSIGENVAEMKGRIGGLDTRLSAMPTTWQLLTFTIGAVLGSAGLAFTIARMMTPLIKL